MDLHDLITICEMYASMGTSVSCQLKDVVHNGEYLEDQNGHAMRIASRFLQNVAKMNDVPEIDGLEEMVHRIDSFYNI